MNQNNCPLCDCTSNSPFWQVEASPVFCNVLYDSRDKALQADCGPIHLSHCSQCDLIYNSAFDPELVAYCPDYENSLHFSPHFQTFAQSMADELVERHQLQDKDIVEIGCGQGDFLEMLQSAGGNRCVGFDPSYSAQKKATGQQSKVKIVPEYYSTTHADWPADFICCRHVLEHIHKPLEFLQSLRATIGDKLETIVYFEVPNALYTLKDLGIWDIIYEHCSYFTGPSLAEVFRRAGFEPLRVAEQYQGQFLTIEAKPASQSGQGVMPVSVTAPLVESFSQAYQQKYSDWQSKMAGYQQASQNVLLWGAGSKGVTFLNALQLSHEHVSCIVDINPRKLGKFTAGTAQEIISAETVASHDPEMIVIMNAIYLEEIRSMLQEKGLKPQLITA